MASASLFGQEGSPHDPCQQDSITERENCRGLIDNLQWRAENREVEPLRSEHAAELRALLKSLFDGIARRDLNSLNRQPATAAEIIDRLSYGKATKSYRWKKWVRQLRSKRAAQSQVLRSPQLETYKDGGATAQVDYGFRRNGITYQCGIAFVRLRRSNTGWQITQIHFDGTVFQFGYGDRIVDGCIRL